MATETTTAVRASGARRRRPSPERTGPAPRVLRLVLFYFVLLIVAAIFICPYLFAVFASFKPLSGVLGERPWIPPTSLSTTNFTQVLFDYKFTTYLANTLMVTVILTVGQVVFSMLGAYAFARLQFPGREALFWVYLATLMVPGAVTMIPLYVIMDNLHLLNTYWALFLPYVLGTPYMIFLMRQYLLTIPQDLIEAARIDGCGEVRILWQMIVPLSRPILITSALIAFVFGWNNFLWPLIATNSTALRMNTVGIADLQSNFGTQWNLVLAGSLLALIPMVILFLIFQKQIVRSISLTGVSR
jgi:multiple sugar transport system permease protein